MGFFFCCLLVSAFTDSDDSLAVIGPSEVENGSTQNLQLDFQDVLLVGGIPDSNVSSNICSAKGESY
jgi:hypothetical protein